MIKTLQRKITLLLALMLGMIWIGVIAAFNLSNYREALMEMKGDVREEIRESGWKKFVETRGESVNLEEVDYALFLVDGEGKPQLLKNHYPGMSDEKLLEYGRQICENRKTGIQFLRVTYFVKTGRHIGTCFVVVNGAPALRAILPTMMISLVLGIVGLFSLIVASRIISGWIVNPVRKMLESEKRFMSDAGHELKTPLTVISANTQLLLGENGDNKNLQYIRQETERMTVLVNKMLRLVRLDVAQENMEHRKFSISEALLDVICPMESIAYEKQIQMDIRIPENMEIVGDEAQMQSVMSVLLDNAISYTPKGGQIQIQAELHAKRFFLRVSNTGEPIPEEMQHKLFERFFRADEARGDKGDHFGLGLSIAAKIVEQHHGKITVQSENGMNIFQVILPVSGRKQI